jgi:hypothetical protein
MVHALLVGGFAAWLTLLLSLGAIAAAIAYALRPERWAFAAAGALYLADFVAGAAGTIVGLHRAFEAVAHVAPELRAELLSQGVSDAINCTVFATLAFPLWLVPFVIGQVRRTRRLAAAAR